MGSIFRLVAVALLVAAVWPRVPSRHDHVLVIALDGARLKALRRLASDGTLPNVSALLARAAGGTLYGGSRRDPRGFWRSALAETSWSGEPLPYVWDRAAASGLRSAAVGLPETRETLSPATLVLPGADEESGFIGDNAGSIVNVASLARADLAWPYDSAADSAMKEMAGVGPGSVSDWIRVRLARPDGRGGVFRIYRLDTDTAYLSPVYRSATPARKYLPGADDDAMYVPDDPAWSVGSSRLRDYFYRHARDVTGSRADLAVALARKQWPLLIYFEPLLGLVDQAYVLERETDVADRTVLRDAYRTIDARIGMLAAAAGPRAAVVLLGREPAPRRGAAHAAGARTTTGFIFVGQASHVGTRLTAKPAHLTRVARTLLHLTGVPSADRRAPIPEVAERFPRRGAETQLARSRGRRDAGVPLSAESLRRLGLLLESTHAPAAHDGDGSAASAVAID